MQVKTGPQFSDLINRGLTQGIFKVGDGSVSAIFLIAY
jgi:hypothetical protein